MGFYINPTDCTKEEFLRANGTRIKQEECQATLDTGTHLPVCLIDNGAFTAAGILYNQQALNYWLQPRSDDHRLRWFFSVSRHDLRPYLPKGD